MLMNWCVHSAQAGSLKWVDPKTKKRLAKAAKAAAAKAEKEAAKASMPKAERKVKEKKEKKEKVKKPKKEKKASETFCIWGVLSKWCSAASMPFFCVVVVLLGAAVLYIPYTNSIALPLWAPKLNADVHVRSLN